MKLSLTALACVALLATVAATASGVAAAPVASHGLRETALLRLPPAALAGQTVLYGHIASLRRKGRWVMRFDPALLLKGTAAEQAAFEDTGSRDVPNDSYTLEEGHRLVTYTVSPNAPVTVLTKGLGTATISVAELSQILQGKNPKHRKLFGQPKSSGFWIRVGDKYPNPVLSLDQQYHP
jgi:hypothetical protein